MSAAGAAFAFRAAAQEAALCRADTQDRFVAGAVLMVEFGERPEGICGSRGLRCPRLPDQTELNLTTATKKNATAGNRCVTRGFVTYRQATPPRPVPDPTQRE